MRLIEIAGRENFVNPEPTHQTELLKQKPSDPKSIDQVVTTLQKECGEVLNVYKKANGVEPRPAKLMFRGERSDVAFFKNSIWVKRKPKYLDRFTHDVSVQAFTNLGLIANRENSIFCAKYSIAKVWGNSVYVIFPVDGYEVTWFDSPKVGKYMYHQLEYAENEFVSGLAKKKFPEFKRGIEGNTDAEYNKNRKMERDYDEFSGQLHDDLRNKNSPLKKEFETFVTNLVKKFNPVSNELERALNTKHNNEYLVTGNAYYGVQLEWMLANPPVFERLFKKA